MIGNKGAGQRTDYFSTKRGRTMLAAAVLATALTPLAAAGARPLADPAAAAPVCKGADGYAASFGGRRTFLLAPDIMARLKASKTSDPTVKAAYDVLIAKAEAAMKRPLYTVTDKLVIPVSGDRHDYLSTVPNWWPDPAKPNGPYIRKDEVNPDRLGDKFDIGDLDKMSSDVEVLSLAYYFSDDARYAARAANIVRTWFITPDYRMNPNLNYAQSVIGREEGRPDGILEFARVQRVIEGVGLIAPSGRFTQAETTALEKWFSDYIDWLRSSKHGKNERIVKGFQSVWYDSQLAYYALFARRPDVVKSVIGDFAKNRFDVQFSTDGKLPIELARSRSLYYSIYTLQGAYTVAEVGACVGADLWNQNDGGRSLRGATDFLAGYRTKLDSWPYPESAKNPNDLDELLYRANRTWGSAYSVNPKVELVRYMRYNW